MDVDDRERLIRACYATWTRGDLAGSIELLDPEFEMQTSGYFPGFEPVYRGHDEWQRFWNQMREPWEWFEIVLEQFVPGREAAVTENSWRALGRGSGVVTELTFGHLFEFRDGRIVRLAAFRSFDEALQELGPAEPR